MGRISDEFKRMRIDELAKLARFKSNKWLLKRAITVCGPNQLGELLKHIEDSFEDRTNKFDSQQRWLNEETDYNGRSIELVCVPHIMHNGLNQASM